MLRVVLELFTRTSESSSDTHTVELATAALMSEIIRADNDTHEDELAVYEQVLQTHFSLSDEELNTLKQDGRETAEDAVDLVQFTKVINELCDHEQKSSILRSLWQIAFADQHIAPVEEHMIRRIADLLYLPHSEFIRAKLDVTGH